MQKKCTNKSSTSKRTRCTMSTIMSRLRREIGTEKETNYLSRLRRLSRESPNKKSRYRKKTSKRRSLSRPIIAHLKRLNC